MEWKAGLQVSEIGSPQRIAPYSTAVAAEFQRDNEVLATGRLVLLHDPAGNDAWGGDSRLVSYVRTDVDLEMVADPLLPGVAWNWFIETLADHDATANHTAGTVTASYSKGFGEMSDHPQRGDVELRCSWSPELTIQALTRHLQAWQDLITLLAGQPFMPTGITTFRGSRL